MMEGPSISTRCQDVSEVFTATFGKSHRKTRKQCGSNQKTIKERRPAKAKMLKKTYEKTRDRDKGLIIYWTKKIGHPCTSTMFTQFPVDIGTFHSYFDRSNKLRSRA